jgi:hypothetical protein
MTKTRPITVLYYPEGEVYWKGERRHPHGIAQDILRGLDDGTIDDLALPDNWKLEVIHIPEGDKDVQTNLDK